jgi:hypothetical protein
MPNIYSDNSASLTTQYNGVVEPIDPCTSWQGSWEGATGVTGSLQIIDQLTSGGGLPAAGTPYITTSKLTCGVPDSNSGAETADFVPNDFTGTVEFYEVLTDAVGTVYNSNVLNYTCIAPGDLIVNVGPNENIDSESYTFSASASGSTGASFLWTLSSGPTGVSPSFVGATALNATVNGLTLDGAYVFTITAQPISGTPAVDSVTIGRFGAAPPTAPLTWSLIMNSGDGSLIIERNGTVIVSATSFSNGTVTTGFNNGDSIQVTVTKPKTATDYTNVVTLDVTDNPGGGLHSDSESNAAGLEVSVVYTFTYNINETYEIQAVADKIPNI